MFLIRDTWQCHTNCRKPNPGELQSLLVFMFSTHNGYKISNILVSTSSKHLLQESKLSFERKTNQKIFFLIIRVIQKCEHVRTQKWGEKTPNTQALYIFSPFVGRFNVHWFFVATNSTTEMSTFPGVFSKSGISRCWGSSQCVWAAESQHFLWHSRARSCCTTSQAQPWYKPYSAASATVQTLPSQYRQTEANLCCGQQKWLRSSFCCGRMERRTMGLPAQPFVSANPETGMLATALKASQHGLSPEALHGQQQK